MTILAAEAGLVHRPIRHGKQRHPAGLYLDAVHVVVAVLMDDNQTIPEAAPSMQTHDCDVEAAEPTRRIPRGGVADLVNALGDPVTASPERLEILLETADEALGHRPKHRAEPGRPKILDVQRKDRAHEPGHRPQLQQTAHDAALPEPVRSHLRKRFAAGSRFEGRDGRAAAKQRWRHIPAVRRRTRAVCGRTHILCALPSSIGMFPGRASVFV